MQYCKSLSRNEFEKSLFVLIKQVKYVSVKTNKIPDDISQCVYKNAIFQSSALLEEYVKTILEDWIEMLHENKKSLKHAPKELILWAAGAAQKKSFEKFIINRNENEFIKELSKVNNLSFYFNNDKYVSDVINRTSHIYDRKSPSDTNIKALFNRFGLHNIFTEMNKKGERDYKKILRSFLDIRNSIAHQNNLSQLTNQDVKDKLNELKDFVNKMDRVLFTHVIKISGTDCWRNQFRMIS